MVLVVKSQYKKNTILVGKISWDHLIFAGEITGASTARVQCIRSLKRVARRVTVKDPARTIQHDLILLPMITKVIDLSVYLSIYLSIYIYIYISTVLIYFKFIGLVQSKHCRYNMYFGWENTHILPKTPQHTHPKCFTQKIFHQLPRQSSQGTLLPANFGQLSGSNEPIRKKWIDNSSVWTFKWICTFVYTYTYIYIIMYIYIYTGWWF